jgi:UPF0716 protein FxsA
MGLIWLIVIVCAEVWSISKVGHEIGALATIILLAAGFIFGLKLMRSQGINAMIKSSQSLQSGESPVGPIAEGVVKAFAGILLILPGFVSDLIALILLLPFVRKAFARHLAKKGQFQGFAAGNMGGFGMFGGGFVPGGFGSGNFGKGPGVRDGGNIYEHDGSARVDDKDVIEGQVLEHKPERKE